MSNEIDDLVEEILLLKAKQRRQEVALQAALIYLVIKQGGQLHITAEQLETIPDNSNIQIIIKDGCISIKILNDEEVKAAIQAAESMPGEVQGSIQ